jgi:ankyrin repeat protein
VTKIYKIQFLRHVIVSLLVLVWSSLAFCGEIHDAAKNGDLEKVKTLLKDNPDLVFSKDYTNGVTPLHIAAARGDTNVAKLLITHKADVNAKDNNGMTPLHYAVFLAPYMSNNSGNKAVAELLLTHNADVNATNNFGATPLYFAAVAGDKDMVELLLANKADVNAKENRGWTPLHMAAGNGYNPESEKRYKDVADLLRQHGGHE